MRDDALSHLDDECLSPVRKNAHLLLFLLLQVDAAVGLATKLYSSSADGLSGQVSEREEEGGGARAGRESKKKKKQQREKQVKRDDALETSFARALFCPFPAPRCRFSRAGERGDVSTRCPSSSNREQRQRRKRRGGLGTTLLFLFFAAAFLTSFDFFRASRRSVGASSPRARPALCSPSRRRERAGDAAELLPRSDHREHFLKAPREGSQPVESLAERLASVEKRRAAAAERTAARRFRQHPSSRLPLTSPSSLFFLFFSKKP